MQRNFFSNLAFLIVLNLLIKPFWVFGIDRTVQNRVGAEEYGLFFALFSFSFLFNMLLDAGINNFNNRNISQNQQLLTKHFSGIVILKVLLGIFYLIAVGFMGWIAGYRVEQLRLLMLIACNHFLLLFILYLQSNISGMQMFRFSSIISVLDRFLMIIFCSLLLWTNIFSGALKIEWFVMIQSISYIFTALTAFIFLLPKIEEIKPKWDVPFFMMILKQSFPFALLTLLMTIYIRTDAFMLERLLPDGKMQAGIYAQAYRILEAANMLAFLFPTLLLPMFSRMLKQKKSTSSSSLNLDIIELLLFSSTMLFCFGTVLTVIAVFYSFPIMEFLYREHTILSAEVLIILMFTFIAFTFTFSFSTLLTANGNLKELNIMAACCVLLNVGMNLILIPEFSVKGAAVTALTTQYIAASFQIYWVNRIFKPAALLKYFIRIVYFAAGVFLSGWIVHTISLHWFTSIIIICMVSALMFLLLSKSSLKRAIRFLSGDIGS